VKFTNSSQNATSYTWDFGDGNSSVLENPENIYSKSGAYNVELTSTNTCGSKSVSKALNITNNLSASFTTDSDGCKLSVNFTDASTGNIGSWSWDFGDGKSSTLQNPSNEYSTPGVYTVKLTVVDGGDEDTYEKQIEIKATPTSDFTYVIDGNKVEFTNTSENATSYTWDFGDGTTSEDENPTVLYENGDYEVVLLAKNGNCTDEYSIGFKILVTDVGSSKNMYDIHTYPNPSNGEITITMGDIADKLVINIYDATGHIVLNKTYYDTGKVMLKMRELQQGIYFMHLSNGDELLKVERISIIK
jgi:PKD repeat protein